MTESGYGKDDDQVAFADGFPLLLIGQASLEDLSQKVGRSLEMLRFRPNLLRRRFYPAGISDAT